ncbi:hypothetical protein IFM89_020359 [Coptis chinensis]|uniref:Transposase MuDR plant domain-containing protein n=1 Tax=Coptis chinensis TaxID=261450 RepID=A0A835HKX5_9MAGN|nr:hypothetical protein IFM89_020359 [Coptis chinensis]
MGEAVRVRRSPRFHVYNQSSSNNVQPTEKPPTVKHPTKKQEKPLRKSGRLQKLNPLVGPNGETLMLDLVSSSDDEVEEIVEVEHVVDVAEPEVAYINDDVVDDWEPVLGSLDPEIFDEVTLGETFTDGDGDDDALDDRDRSDDEDEDVEDYNYNPSDSDYSVCGTDDEALDDMEPMVLEEEVQNLEEEIQGSYSNVVRVSTNIFEAAEMAKLGRPIVENVFVCDLKPKMSWPTVETCRDFFRNLAIRKKFSYRHMKNDKERLILECKDFNCQWKVSASVTKRDNHTFILRNILRKFWTKDTCEADDENKYAHATSPWVAKTLVNKVRDYPDYKPMDIQKEIFFVPEMCRQIEKSNPGSLVKWFVKDSNHTFVGVVIAFKGSLDGLDAMNEFFPIGFYVCKGENKDTWMLFLSELTPHLIKHKEKLTFISDKKRFCFRHMYKNFKVKFPGELWKSLTWEAAMTYKLPELTRILGTKNITDIAALDWLDNEPRECWARAHFDWTSKCDELTNNFRLPYVHAVVVLKSRREPWSRYCNPYFSAKAFKATYSGYLYTLDNIKDWPEITLDKELVLAPEVTTQPGRPRKQRIRADDEMPKSKKKCAKCQEESHNSRSCDARKKGEFGKKKKRKGKERGEGKEEEGAPGRGIGAPKLQKNHKQNNPPCGEERKRSPSARGSSSARTTSSRQGRERKAKRRHNRKRREWKGKG